MTCVITVLKNVFFDHLQIFKSLRIFNTEHLFVDFVCICVIYELILTVNLSSKRYDVIKKNVTSVDCGIHKTQTYISQRNLYILLLYRFLSHRATYRFHVFLTFHNLEKMVSRFRMRLYPLYQFCCQLLYLCRILNR